MNVNLIIISLFLLSILSCKKEGNTTSSTSTTSSVDNGNNEVKISTHNSFKSHNMGQNCISCHQQGGSGEGWFTGAGTVYDSLQTSPIANRTIKLFTGPNGSGTLIKTMQVDGRGNFYTTEAIDFSVGLYPSIVGNSTTKYMGSAISTGNCMSCHGVSTSKIWGD